MPSKTWKPRLKVNMSFSQVENNPVDRSSSLEENQWLKTNQKTYKEETDQMTDKEESSQKMWFFFPETKKLDKFCLKRPASHGSIKRLQTQSKLTIGKVRPVLCLDKAVFHKVPFNSIKVSKN